MKLRWWVCLLLFLTWVLSYVDRSLMPMALASIGEEFRLSPTAMGMVISAFFVGYGLMQIPGGLLADKFGPRRSVTLGIAFWSLCSLLTGAAHSMASLLAVRVCFGLGEGIHPPATFKILGAWFPQRERSRANGMMMSSNTIGPMLTPFLFAAAIGALGWRRAFYVLSLPGFLLAFLSYYFLRDQPADHPRISNQELNEIAVEERMMTKLSVSQLLKYKALWQLCFIYLTWDITWWGFQAWLPTYLLKDRGFSLIHSGVFAALPFAAGFLGLLTAAYVSDRSGRRRVVLVVALLGNAFFMLLTANAVNTTWAIIFLTATGFFLPAIQGPFWSLPMDLLPLSVMGYASGFINTGGQLAGAFAPVVIGALIENTGRYKAGFLFMALSAGFSAVLVCLLKEGHVTPAGIKNSNWHQGVPRSRNF
jgi:sugar phosphate permease